MFEAVKIRLLFDMTSERIIFFWAFINLLALAIYFAIFRFAWLAEWIDVLAILDFNKHYSKRIDLVGLMRLMTAVGISSISTQSAKVPILMAKTVEKCISIGTAER